MNIYTFLIVLISHSLLISAQNSTENPVQEDAIETTTVTPDDSEKSQTEPQKTTEAPATTPKPESLEKPSDKPSDNNDPKQNDTATPRNSENQPNFNCAMLEMCDMDNPLAKIVGILEEKVVKLEKKFATIMQRFEELEGETKNRTEELQSGLMEKMGNVVEKCGKCADSQNNGTDDPVTDEMAKPTEGPGQARNLPKVAVDPKNCSEMSPPSPSDGTTANPSNPAPESGNMNPPPPTEEEFHPLKTLGENPRCLEASGGGVVIVKRCKTNSPQQEWSMRPDGTFQNKATKQCLDGGGEVGVVAVPCDNSVKTQQWQTAPDNTIKNTGTWYCLTNGAYGAITAECDGNYWQQYDFLKRIRQPEIVFVTYHFKR